MQIIAITGRREGQIGTCDTGPDCTDFSRKQVFCRFDNEVDLPKYIDPNKTIRITMPWSRLRSVNLDYILTKVYGCSACLPMTESAGPPYVVKICGLWTEKRYF